jgi:hypothetical protein
MDYLSRVYRSQPVEHAHPHKGIVYAVVPAGSWGSRARAEREAIARSRAFWRYIARGTA